MPVGLERDAGEECRIDRSALGLEGVDDLLHVGGVPEGDDVEDETEGAEGFLLPLSVSAGEFAAIAVTDAPGELVPVFLTVELDENADRACERNGVLT